MLRTLSLLFLLTASSFVSAQLKLPSLNSDDETLNLVRNPGFEKTNYTSCKWNQGLGKFNKWMIDWTCPTETTPDVLSKRADSDCWAHPRKHSEGRQSTHSGDNMVGLKIYGKGGSDTYWHEYVQIELEEPLKADSLYYAHVWVNLSRRASKATNNIGIAMSAKEVVTNTRHPLYMTPVVNSEKIIKQSLLGWEKVSGVFRASGDEKFLLIGNFYSDKETSMERLDRGKDGAYYYMDDVMLRRAYENEKETREPRESKAPQLVVVEERASTEEVELETVKYQVGTTIELEKVYFEFDKADLKPESQKELNKLADLLFDYPYMEIEVSGHTDNKGAADYNLRLSEARAQAVVAYLLHKDVDKERLSFTGMGSKLPIADNTTEEGQQANRRVEFKILKN